MLGDSSSTPFGDKLSAAVRSYLIENRLVDVKGVPSLGRINSRLLAEIAQRVYDDVQARLKAAKKRRAPFVPPTPEEVSVYAKSIGYELDGENFCLSYEKKDWCTSGTTKMRNWQSAVKQWKLNGYSGGKAASVPGRSSLGALRMEMTRVEEELSAILYPGGSAQKILPEAGTPLHQWALDLGRQRDGLKKQIREIALGTAI